MAYTVALLEELLNEKRKNIYCFGAGRLFDTFVRESVNYNLEDKIKAIVDNDQDVVNNSVKVVNGISVPIISFEEMLKNLKSDDKIIITTMAYEEIIEQIKKVKALNDINYYIYFVLRIEQQDYDWSKSGLSLQISAYKSIQIPKIIHYCWFGGEKIPDQYRKWMESWKRYCPDYEIIEWNEENYDVHKSLYISQAYEAKQWAFVSDYARIDIINQYGGVYLDVDVELLKNIDEMLKNNAFCGFESKEYVAYGLGFGAKKENSILGEIKDYYDSICFRYDDGRMNRVSCPIIQTKIMKKHGLKCNGEFQIVDGITVYPPCILCGMSPYSFRVEKNPVHTYAIHHFAGSWMEDKRGKSKLIIDMKKWGRNDSYIYPSL